MPVIKNTKDHCAAVCCKMKNFTDADLAKWHPFVEGKAGYTVYGEEVGSECGTPHLQMYFELRPSIRFSALKKVLPTIHVEERHGTPKQAAGYCKNGIIGRPKEGAAHFCVKEKDFCWSMFYEAPHPTWKGDEYGVISNHGNRADLDSVATAVEEGAASRKVAHEFPTQYIKYLLWNKGAAVPVHETACS